MKAFVVTRRPCLDLAQPDMTFPQTFQNTKPRAIFRAPFTCKERILWGNGLVPSIFHGKKLWLSIRRCPLHANPEELVSENHWQPCQDIGILS
jgi:hypothetical protein